MRDGCKWLPVLAAAAIFSPHAALGDDPPDVVKKAAPTEKSGERPAEADPFDEAERAESAQVPAVLHTPLASAPADEPLTITTEVRASQRFTEVLLYYRRAGEVTWRRVVFARAGTGGFTATIPAAHTAAGTLEYYLAASTSDGAGEHPRFASPELPHSMALLGDNEARWQRELLAQQYGNRSRFHLRGEYVNFGGRTDASGNPIPDDYWHAELDYTYRILGWIYSISVGAGYLGGRNYSFDGASFTPTSQVGMGYGYTGIRFRMGRLVRGDLRIVLGAGPTKIDGGAGGMLLIGSEPGTHFDVGFEYLTEVGARGFLRLAWNTVRWFPMSFTLEATTWPLQNDISGRVYLTVEYRFGTHVILEVTGGYAARTWRIGGPSAGLGARFEF
jgi:hypothetical protein